MKTTKHLLAYYFFILLISTCSFAASTDPAPANIAGKWQFSWEARIGTETGVLQLEQSGAKLTGSYRGHLASTKITGSIDANQVNLNFDFAGVHTFSLAFTGTLDGGKMSGKFEIPGFKNGYDSHGENVRPSNYTWNAVRLPDQPQTANPPNSVDQKDMARK
jgi:hypothetical protein